MASVVVELNQQRSDSSLASKSTRSHAPMDIVPLDMSCNEKHEIAAKCNHFSIRGYVSEVRKKDPKVCYPFPLKDLAEPIELPPMVIPQFRWWQCNGCVPEVRVANDKDAQKPEEIVDASLPLVGQSSTKVNIPRVRNGEASTSIDSNDNKNYSPPIFFTDQKGKGKAHVEDEPTPTTVLDNGFPKDSSQVQLHQITGKIEVSLTTADEVIPESSFHGNGGIINTLWNDSSEEGIEAGPSKESVNHDVEFSNENCGGKPLISSQCRNDDAPPTDVVPVQLEPVNGPSNESNGRLMKLPDLNECSGEPLCDENNEAMIAGSNIDVFCEDDDDYLGAERRKNPKVRLMSELLGMKETRISSKGRKKNTSLTNSMGENVKRKRMGSQDEGSRSMEVKATNNGAKKISRTAETSESDSETDSDDVSMEIISKALTKRRCRSKIPLFEKRNKRGKVDHGGSSSVSRQKILSRSVGIEKGKTSENLPRKSDVTDQLIDRSSVLTKKRNKVLQSGKEVSFFSCKSWMPKDSATTQDEDAEKSPAEKVQQASENLHHLSKSLLMKKNSQAQAPTGANGICLPSQAEPVLVDESSVRKHQENRSNVGETSVACKTTAVGTPTESPCNAIGESSTAAKSILEEKRSQIPEAEEGTPLSQDMPLQASKPVVNQKELAGEVQRRMRDIDINSIPADDKVTDQGPVDDIPMDIVELMAKNQYERHLSDPQEKHNNPAPSVIPGKYDRDNRTTNSFGENWQKFGQQPFFLSMQKPPFPDARNSMANGNIIHVSDLNCSTASVSGSFPGENSVSARFLSPTHGQEHRPPYPTPCGLSINNWNGTINVATPQRYPPSGFIQAVESYRYQTCAPRQNTTEAQHVWPPVVASRMPLGITNPQIISQSSDVVNKGNIHRKSSGSILNFNASPAPAHLGKQQNLDFSNACSKGHSESSAGSADYTSAMHLLSLMQNAAKLPNAALSLGPQKVVGPTNSRQPYVKNNSRTSTMQDSLRHPCYPAAARPHFTSAFQGDVGSVGRNSNKEFAGPIPLTLRGQRNIENSHFVQPIADHRPQRRQVGSSSEKGKNVSAASHASYVKSLDGVMGAAPNFLSGVRRDEKTVLPTPEKEICQLNQNPSEFNDPREWSRYMIGPEDLRPKGKGREGTSRAKGDSRRQDFRLNKHMPSGREREKQRK